MPLSWYYMWSTKYRFFHEILQASMNEPEFKLEPIYIDQSFFDNALYKKEGQHSWSGCALKVNLLIERLESSTDSYIIFSDVDLIIKPGVYTTIQRHIDNEDTMAFIKEGDSVNIGFCLVKVCNETIQFWKQIKSIIDTSGGHDQSHVNTLLKEYTGKWSTFNAKEFALSNTYDGSEFYVLQVLSSCLSKELDFAEKIFSTAQHMNIQPYMQYVEQHYIPYIYEFQEIYCKAYQAAVNS